MPNKEEDTYTSSESYTSDNSDDSELTLSETDSDMFTDEDVRPSPAAVSTKRNTKANAKRKRNN